jgi:signal transduction histidine kinase/ActR/RegA family two-component response regulator
MSKPDKVSVLDPAQSLEPRTERREKILYGIIALTFVAIWKCRPYFPYPDNYFLFYLIPTLLTFVARKRGTILGVGAASVLAAFLDISQVRSFRLSALFFSPDKIQADPQLMAMLFAATLHLMICYFSVRQWRILTTEQKKRAQRDARLREIASELTALERRQRALQRLTSLLAENAPVAIAQLTPELQYAMVNPIYLHLMRAQTGEADLEMIGKKLTEHLWKTDAQAQEALSLIGHGLPVKMPAQTSVARVTGRVTYWDWTLWPVKDESSATESVLLLGAEVTERIQAEQKLESARSELEKSNHAKDLFLATLSHELRTPLTPILGWARIMQDYQADGTITVQGLQAIERNARLQAQLVDDLLDLSRITMGKIELARAPVDLNEIVRRALETVQYRIESQELDVRLELRAESLLVNGDATRLEQVIWNLLTNAVKFTPSGGQITIRSRLAGNECQIEVSDNGIGIEPHILPLLFEPFKQGDSSITRRHGGLGIGLAIAHSLVQMHGGRISARSAGAGQGASFTVALPNYQRAPVTPAATTDDVRPLRLDGLKVLVLEDAADTRELLGIVLQAHGCQVELTESVPEAWKAAMERKPDVILSDIGLPDADGYEFARQLRRTPGFERVPMIALTGYAMDADRQKAHENGFDRHLPKPIDPEVLVQVISELHTQDAIGPLFRSLTPGRKP